MKTAGSLWLIVITLGDGSSETVAANHVRPIGLYRAYLFNAFGSQGFNGVVRNWATIQIGSLERIKGLVWA